MARWDGREAKGSPPAVGIGWRAEIAGPLLAAPDVADFLEVVAEPCFASRSARREVEAIAEIWPVVPHGLKLSLGSADGIEPERARRLGDLARSLRSPLISEHVAFVRAGGREVGHFTALPRTRAAVRVVARNVAAVRRLLPDVPLLLENAAWTVPWPDNEMGEGAFYTEIVDATDCDLLLDVANLYANAVNEGQAPEQRLREFPLERVGMMHVAGGTTELDVGGGFYVDTHAHPVAASVLALVEAVGARAGRVPVLLERDDLFPPFVELAAELAELRRRVETADVRLSGQRAPAAVAAAPALPADRLAMAQAALARLLTDARPPEPAAAAPFPIAAITRTRGILTRKRADQALPLLEELLALGAPARELARRALADRPRAASQGAVADAAHIAAAAAREPRLADAAARDWLLLRARFAGLASGAPRPRRSPFIGRAVSSGGDSLLVWLAEAMVPDLREKLRETHLVRSRKAVAARRLMVAAGGAFLLAVGAIRWIRGVELGHPVGLLTFELVVLSVVLVLLFWRTTEKSSLGAAYVEWLDAATTSFRWRVQRQPDPRAADLRLAVAIAGATALPAIVSARFPHAALAAIVSRTVTTNSDGGAGCGGGCGGCGGGCGG